MQCYHQKPLNQPQLHGGMSFHGEGVNLHARWRVVDEKLAGWNWSPVKFERPKFYVFFWGGLVRFWDVHNSLCPVLIHELDLNHILIDHSRGMCLRTADSYGSPGWRCDPHGGRLPCNVPECPRNSVGRVQWDDKFGLAGHRCYQHGARRCEVWQTLKSNEPG